MQCSGGGGLSQGHSPMPWTFFFFSEFYLCFQLCWVFVAASRFFSSCGEQGLLFIAVCGLLIAVASLIAEHGI